MKFALCAVKQGTRRRSGSPDKVCLHHRRLSYVKKPTIFSALKLQHEDVGNLSLF